MARSLEGRWFHLCYNSGVHALVSNEVYENQMRRNAIILAPMMDRLREQIDKRDILPHIPDRPIFTFARQERVQKSPWFTGMDTDTPGYPSDLKRLLNYITRNGGQFANAGFYVPFSNGTEMGRHGTDSQFNELRYVTTNSQFEETFGISLNELRDSGHKYL